MHGYFMFKIFHVQFWPHSLHMHPKNLPIIISRKADPKTQMTNSVTMLIVDDKQYLINNDSMIVAARPSTSS